jgi:hypothetical protein
MKSKRPISPEASNVVVPFPSSRAQRSSADESGMDEMQPGGAFHFRLRSGFSGWAIVPEGEAERLWHLVQDLNRFHHVVIFDTFKRRIALSLLDLVATQFVSFDEGWLRGVDIDDGPETVRIVFSASNEQIEVDVEPDLMTLAAFGQAEEDDPLLCQLDSLLFHFAIAYRGSDDVARLCDEDGCETWLRIKDVPFVSVPLSLLAEPRKRRRRTKRRKKETEPPDTAA